MASAKNSAARDREEYMNIYRVPRCTLSAAFVPSATLEIRPDSFSRSLSEFRKLSCTAVDYRLYLFLGLFRDWYDAVQVLVDEESHEHLPIRLTGALERSQNR